MCTGAFGNRHGPPEFRRGRQLLVLLRGSKRGHATGTICRHFREFDWPWYMPTISDYALLIEDALYSEKRIWGENADRYFPTVDAMTQWVDQPSLVPLLKCVATEDKGPFREYAVRRMIEKTKQENGTCFETFRRVNLFARK